MKKKIKRKRKKKNKKENKKTKKKKEKKEKKETNYNQDGQASRPLAEATAGRVVPGCLSRRNTNQR